MLLGEPVDSLMKDRDSPPLSDRTRASSGAETRCCPARSRFEVGWAGLFTTQLGDILRKTQIGEAGGEPRAERSPSAAFVSDRVAENLANFLFSAVAMAACAELKLGFDVVFEVSDQELSHDIMISLCWA